MVQVLRNGIETDKFQPVPAPDNDKPVIAIIGRLSGPRGALPSLLDEVLDLEVCRVRVVSGTPGAGTFHLLQRRSSSSVMWTMCLPCWRAAIW